LYAMPPLLPLLPLAASSHGADADASAAQPHGGRWNVPRRFTNAALHAAADVWLQRCMLRQRFNAESR